MAYGTVNADVIGTSIAGSNVGAGNASIMKNRIINGAMVIDQRNAGASVTVPNTGSSGNVWGVDRFVQYATQASKFTVQQNAGSVTPPVGFTNYLGHTSSSAYSVASGDYFFTAQKIEGFNTADLQWGTANAKTVTLSFWAYSSLTGTFGGSILNSAINYSYPFSYSIPTANTWTQISITIAGPTAGTWIGATNGTGMWIVFSVGAGSTASGTAGSWSANQYFSATGATSVVGTSGATFYITGVQLEVGSSATGFEYRQYQQELALCQRYYEMSYNQGSTPGTTGTVGSENNYMAGTFTAASLPVTFKVSKRATPTVTAYSTSDGASGFINSVGNGNQTANYDGQGMRGFRAYCTFTSGSANLQMHWVSTAEL
jgi:hypothetical protein